MEKVKHWIRVWLNVPGSRAIQTGYEVYDEKLKILLDEIRELRYRVDDLESAYPDYKKAKAKADDEKANEIVPGFTPFTQRKRQWEATRRRPQKKS